MLTAISGKISASVTAISWQDGALKLLDQRRLPQHEEYLLLRNVAEVAIAITSMAVRGAPAIGIAAAYGVVLAARARYLQDPHGWKQVIEEDLALLAASRPTAVNLSWALARMRRCMDALHHDPESALLTEALNMHNEDIEANTRMGALGAAAITPCQAVLTHCNTGALATGGYGTALGVIRSAFSAGKISRVYANETRPWLQGTRLTVWELAQERIPVTLIADSAAAYLMRQGKVQWVIVGADRIAANGDVANKIGTYAAALAAHHHGVKFMVVAPSSTIDMSVADGAQIPIETRSADELLSLGGSAVGAQDTDVWNPSFDITPAGLIDMLVTEHGILAKPDAVKLQTLARQMSALP